MADHIPFSAEEENNIQAETYSPEQWFFNKEVISSMLLLVASVSAVYWANSFLSKTYDHLMHMPLVLGVGHWDASTTFLHWVNDGLMSLFFFTVGLEIKREVLVGELASMKMALLPIIAAVGGMLVPGLIYMLFNHGTPYAAGWGIPVATDIAFSLGAIALFGKKLPTGLRVFLAAFAIADDLGAVMIIALFYTKGIVVSYLLAAVIFVLALFIANILWVRWLPVYIVLGIATWVAIMGSGVHATVAGVVVALLIPAQAKYSTGRFVRKARRIIDRMEYQEDISEYWYSILLQPEHLNSVHALEKACQQVETPLQRLEHALHPWVAFLILPLFAFGNAGLSFEGMHMSSALHPVTLGIVLGLFVGKPLGIATAAYIAVKTGVAALPDEVRWSHIIGASMLGGIGFTMSLFISGLSFFSPELLNYSKLGVLAGSILSGLGGVIFLGWNYRRMKRRGMVAETAV